MKQTLTLLFSLFLTINLSLAQQKSAAFNGAVSQTNKPKTLNTVKKTISLKELKKSLDGTYQVEISKPDYQVLYTRDLLETIKDFRKEIEDVDIQWNQYVKIRIYSLQNTHTNTKN